MTRRIRKKERTFARVVRSPGFAFTEGKTAQFDQQSGLLLLPSKTTDDITMRPDGPGERDSSKGTKKPVGGICRCCERR